MKKRAVISIVIVLSLMMLAFAGCAKTPAETPAETTPEDTSVSITDVVGNEVKLDKPATKVVGTHNPTMNQLIILGGGGKYIAGFGNKNMAGNLYAEVYPELKDGVEQIGKGKDVNFEQCVAVGADLAILPERFKDQKADFEAVGIPAAVVLPNAENYDTIKESLMRVATLIGEEKKAQEINEFFDAKIKNATDIAAKSNAKPKILFTGGSSSISVANGAMLQSTMIETAGGVNVAKDIEGSGDYIEVTMEDIVKWDPEIILIPTFADYTIDDILNDAAWGSIKAVKDKKVYSFPSELEPWDYPTPSSAMGLSWLVHTLNPDQYTMDQVVADANDYYQMVYGKTFTAEQYGLTK